MCVCVEKVMIRRAVVFQRVFPQEAKAQEIVLIKAQV